MNIEEIKKQMKKNKQSTVSTSRWNKHISKILITVILTLITLITLKTKPSLQSDFYKQVYDNNIKFTYFNKMYKKYFGKILPTDIFENKTKTVFSENLKYSKKSKYNDGVELKVDSNYLVPTLDSGMVVYVGKRDNYGNTVIVQQTNGIDVWYGNISTVNVKQYDYIEKGSLIGEVKTNKLYLVFKKDGKVLKYEDYI